MWVDGSNDLFDPFVECQKTGMLRVGRFVHGVVTGHHDVVFEVLQVSSQKVI